MNKKELINYLAEEVSVSKKMIKKIMELSIEKIIDELADDNRVELVGFGKFETKHRSERYGTDPRTHQKIVIPETKTVTFSMGSALKREIKKKENT